MPPARSVNPSVLILLGEPVLADLTEFRLQLLGYHVRRVETFDETLTELAVDLPGLLILDTLVEGQDGLQWLITLRSSYAASDLPVLVFSLDPSLDTVQQAFHAGAQDYLITPFDPTVMESKVKSFVGGAVSPTMDSIG